jgi:hypothetical protein
MFGIFGAIAGLFTKAATAVTSFIGGLGTIGSFVLKTAVGVGTSLLGQALAGKPAEQKFSVTTELQAGGDLPRSIIFGYTATAGSLQYANTWGRLGETDNAFLTQVIQLADYPVRDLVELWVNGERCTIGETPHPEYGFPVTEYFKDGHDNLWIRFYDGTQTAADPFLVSRVSSANRPYSDKRVGRGIPYVVVTSLVTKNLFSGIPSFRFGLHGAKLYDPSRDSTVGGVGSHRWGDPSTWGGDGDFLPAVQLYNLLRGIRYGGEWLYGLQNIAAGQLPAAQWIGQIEKCRAGIESADGIVPTYRSGGEVEVNVALGDAIDAFLTTCQGRVSEIGGVYKLHLGAPDTPVMSLTDDDILSTEEQSFTPFFGLADTINGVSARYPSPADGWNMKVAPPLYRADLEALAGNRRLMADVSLDFVPYAEQVQRLMKSALEEAQRARRHTFVLPPAFWPLEPGEYIPWSSRRNGYIDKIFRVEGVVDRANLDVMVDLTEVDPAAYGWNPGADFKPPVSGSLGPVRPTPQVIVDWFAQAWQINDASGTGRRPAIRLSWDGNQPDVEAVAFEVALAETLEVIYRGRTDEPEAGAIVVSQGLLPNENYLVRGRYVPLSDRETVFSGWLPVTTPDIRLTDLDVFLPGMLEDISEAVADLLDWGNNPLSPLVPLADGVARNAADILAESAARVAEAQALADDLQTESAARLAEVAAERSERLADTRSSASSVRDLVETLDKALLQQADILLVQKTESLSIRQELHVEVDGARAFTRDQIDVAVGPNSAVAERFSTTEAAIATEAAARQAAITSVQTAFASADQVEATARQSLAAQLRGSYDGNDAALITSGLLYQQRQTVVSELQALSTAISLVSAGVGEQFDSRVLWHFTYGAEGFTGNGAAPQSTGGFLRPADGADPFVISPAGLAITNNEYSQVKLRMRRTGTPTWRGWVWWNRASDTSWSTDRRVAITEPDWDVNGESVATWTMGWSGTIDRIRVEVAAANSSANRIDFDWIAVGRPAPGASSADIARIEQAFASADLAEAQARQTLSAFLVGQADPTGLTLPTLTQGLIFEERQARAAGDAASALLIDGVLADLVDISGGVDALAQAQQTLQADVAFLESEVAINAADIVDVFASLAGKADAGITDSLQTQINALGDGTSIAVIGDAVRAIQLSVDRVALAQFDAWLNGQQRQQAFAGAVAEVSETMSGRIEATERGLVLTGEQIATINLALPNLASIALTDAMTARISATESGITLQAGRITAVEQELVGVGSELDTKAAQSALNSLSGTVTAQGGTISSILTEQTALQNALTNYRGANAVSNAFNSATSRIFATESGITLQAGRITAVEQELVGIGGVLDTKAAQSALNNLSGTVTAQGGTISSILTEQTALQNALTNYRGANAVSNAFTSAASRISATESGLSVLASQLNLVEASLTSAIGTKAEASYVQYIETIVASNFGYLEGVAASQAGSIQNLAAALSGYGGSNAVANAFNQQSALINVVDGEVSALAAQILGVEAEVDGVSAGGRLKFEVQASPGDGWSRIGLIGSANNGVSFEEAALFLDVRTSGSPRRRIVGIADQFLLTNGADSRQPFTFQDGVLRTFEIRASNAFIQDLVANELTVLGTSNLDFSAATSFHNSGQIDETRSGNFGWTTVHEFTVPAMTGGILQIFCRFLVTSISRAQMRVVRPDIGFILYESNEFAGANGDIGGVDVHRIDPYARNAPTSYQVQFRTINAADNATTRFLGSLTMFYGKR